MKRFLYPALIFAYALALRIHGIEEHFQLFSDQIRDWKIVGQGFLDLPLHGTPRNSGGFSHGPIFYWILWLSRQIIGPLTNQLPHAGGIGVAIFYALSAAALYRAFLQFSSLVFSTVAILFLISSPWEASFSGNTAWNPGVATALVNFAFAAFLGAKTWRGRLLALVFAWLAFQAHFPAIFVFLGLFAGSILIEFRDAGAKKSRQLVFLTLVGILMLEIPYFIWVGQEASAGSPVEDSLRQVLQDPATALHPIGAFRFLKDGAILLLFEDGGVFKRYAVIPVLLVALGVWRFRSNIRWMAVGFLPVLFALAGYSISQIPLDAYHLVTLMASFVLLFVLGVRGIFKGSRIPLWILLVYILAQQSGRFERAPTDRMESYGSLVRGAKAIIQSGKKFSHVEFDESRTDPLFVLECLGAHATPGAAVVSIKSGGEVEWRE
ncbi:MAG: hypothetical protein JNM27_02495 [Leptospirales bacterium]|nr:hypothetical protein [Leptospirales bacterium]